jgi:hypothetical protein
MRLTREMPIDAAHVGVRGGPARARKHGPHRDKPSGPAGHRSQRACWLRHIRRFPRSPVRRCPYPGDIARLGGRPRGPYGDQLGSGGDHVADDCLIAGPARCLSDVPGDRPRRPPPGRSGGWHRRRHRGRCWPPARHRGRCWPPGHGGRCRPAACPRRHRHKGACDQRHQQARVAPPTCDASNRTSPHGRPPDCAGTTSCHGSIRDLVPPVGHGHGGPEDRTGEEA